MVVKFNKVEFLTLLSHVSNTDLSISVFTERERYQQHCCCENFVTDLKFRADVRVAR